MRECPVPMTAGAGRRREKGRPAGSPARRRSAAADHMAAAHPRVITNSTQSAGVVSGAGCVIGRASPALKYAHAASEEHTTWPGGDGPHFSDAQIRDRPIASAASFAIASQSYGTPIAAFTAPHTAFRWSAVLGWAALVTVHPEAR